MKLYSVFSMTVIFSLMLPGFWRFNHSVEPQTVTLETCDCSSAKVWVWNGNNARLTSEGKKKLDKLRQQIKDKTKIKQQMYASDFEYECLKLLRDNPNRCPQGNHYGAQKGWVKYSQVCNKPDYCPNVPGL